MKTNLTSRQIGKAITESSDETMDDNSESTQVDKTK